MPKLLLIEDNEANQDLISRFLQLFGFEVSLATDGLSGLHQARELSGSLDVILMDMNLPELDGWELAGELKSHPLTREIPLIAVTAHAMVGDREKALACGCDGYVTKPIDFRALLEQIATLSAKELA